MTSCNRCSDGNCDNYYKVGSCDCPCHKPAEQKPISERATCAHGYLEGVKPDCPHCGPAKSVSPVREEQPATSESNTKQKKRECAGLLGRNSSPAVPKSESPAEATEEEKDLVNLILYRGYSSSAPAPSDATRMECLTALRSFVQREVEAAVAKARECDGCGKAKYGNLRYCLACLSSQCQKSEQQAVEKALNDANQEILTLAMKHKKKEEFAGGIAAASMIVFERLEAVRKRVSK